MTITQRAAFIILVVVCAALAISAIILALAFAWWLINSALTAVLPVILTL